MGQLNPRRRSVAGTDNNANFKAETNNIGYRGGYTRFAHEPQFQIVRSTRHSGKGRGRSQESSYERSCRIVVNEVRCARMFDPTFVQDDDSVSRLDRL